jgi:hypothetical protein
LDPRDILALVNWLVTCSCGWTRQAFSAWTATAIARLHARYLTGPDLEHDTVTIEELPDANVHRQPEGPGR